MQSHRLGAIFLVVAIAGCSNSVAPLPPAPIQVANQHFATGSEYEIDVVPGPDGAGVCYVGTVGHLSDESVVLDGAVKRVEVVDSIQIPLVGTICENTAIGRQQLTGEVRVSRDQIIAIRPTATSGHSLPVAALDVAQ